MKQIDEQRYLWLFRVFGLFLVISIFLDVVLLIAFSKISPTPKRELFFVSSQNNDVENLYITQTNNQPFSISQGSIGYEIAKNYISEYIIDRESLYSDRSRMADIFGLDGNIYFLSSKPVYEEFISSPEYTSALLNREKKVKTVTIEKIDYQPKSKNWIIEVAIKTTDSEGVNLESETKKISITCNFITNSVGKKSKNKWINPLGFEITSYKYI